MSTSTQSHLKDTGEVVKCVTAIISDSIRAYRDDRKISTPEMISIVTQNIPRMRMLVKGVVI